MTEGNIGCLRGLKRTRDDGTLIDQKSEIGY